MGFNSWLQRKTESWSRSWLMSNTAIQYCSAVCGAMSVTFFFISFGIAGFIPPPAPSWGAERIAEFYQTHTTRIHAGAAINMIAGGFYLPFSTAVSYQIRRIPNIPYIIHQVQLASASAGIWTFMLPGIVLAIASYRPYRPVEITYALNDFFWLVAFMPWPTFMVQNFAFAYAIVFDSRKNPLFPKELALVNILMPVLFALATAMHTVYSGPFAWNGAITFWIIGITFMIQVFMDATYLILAARREEKEGFMRKESESTAVTDEASVV
ncbi:hypothetical protein ACHAPI_011126 [Fusarium lateritium]